MAIVTEEEGKKREVNIERSKARMREKKSPDGLNFSNENTIIINIICQYFIKRWKNYKIELIKKQNGLKRSKNEKSSALPGTRPQHTYY